MNIIVTELTIINLSNQPNLPNQMQNILKN
jgi:hypothetical protein